VCPGPGPQVDSEGGKDTAPGKIGWLPSPVQLDELAQVSMSSEKAATAMIEKTPTAWVRESRRAGVKSDTPVAVCGGVCNS
jgi:hypothetical protein